jgi:hypothetical protein
LLKKKKKERKKERKRKILTSYSARGFVSHPPVQTELL